MKRYIVTDKQLQKMKDLLENDTFGSYWSEEVRELRYLVEDIEAQEVSYRRAHKRLAQEATRAVRAEIKGLPMEGVFLSSIITAMCYEPHLESVSWDEIWTAAKTEEVCSPEEGGAYDVFIKALEGKPC